jgi:hypothetical protein
MLVDAGSPRNRRCLQYQLHAAGDQAAKPWNDGAFRHLAAALRAQEVSARGIGVPISGHGGLRLRLSRDGVLTRWMEEDVTGSHPTQRETGSGVMRTDGVAAVVGTMLLVTTSGCALTAPESLHVVAVAENAVATPERPAVIAVTVTNEGNRRVTYGSGSSTCQLHLLVRVDGLHRFAATERICTADHRTHTLEPGASRMETLEWDGRAWIGNEAVQLEPGDYEVRGAAGHKAMSEPLVITLQETS